MPLCALRHLKINADIYYEPNSFYRPSPCRSVHEGRFKISGNAARQCQCNGDDDYGQPITLFRRFPAAKKEGSYVRGAEAVPFIS
jgi:catalase